MMKKRTLLLSFPLVGLLPAFTNAEQCNQEFYDTLRYGREYDFADNYHANSSDKWVWDKEIMIKEEYDYNQSDYVPKFKRTEAIKDANRKIAKDTSMEIIATDPTQPGYKILAVPEKRSYDNLLVKYTIESSTNAAGNDRYNHTECAYYAITWCGDGILDIAQEGDKWESEECDYNDPNKVGWEDRSGKTCSKSCKIETIQASCGVLDVNSPKYNENHPNPRITESSEGLCEVGNLEAGSFSYDSKTGKYTWNCINGNSNTGCTAQDKWCGDGEVMATKEECDPEHPDYKGKGTCDNNCKLEDPLCSSEYNNKKAYQKPEFLYLKGTELLCNPGIVQDFWKGGVPLRFTWSCKNSTKDPVSCVFNQYRCGDGQVNGGGDWSKNGWIDGKEHYEACDPEASEWKDRTDGQKCNSECGFDKATCGSKANTTEYNVNFPTERITISDAGLCGLGKLVEGSFKLDKTTGKYTWQCINGTKENSCEAQDLRCGDGVKNGTEVCDPKDSTKENWGDGCSATCEKVYGDAVCGSKYNGQTKYQDIKNEWLNKNTNGLCDKGEVVEFLLDKTTGKYVWQCKNGTKVSGVCTAKQEWCGDGNRQEKEEVCDPKDSTKENWGDGCSATCEKTYQDAICGSEYNGKTKYQDINNEWLNKNTNGLCDKGKVMNFSLNKTTGKYTWQCENGTKVSDACTAKQEWCGDGVKNGTEVCDPKDSTKENWGDGCSATCEKVYGDAVCGSKYNGQTKYQDIKNEWLNKNTNGLCDKGEVIEFSLDKITGKYTWQCKNGTKESESCNAQQLWCGNGEVEEVYGEECDGGDDCNSQCKKIKPSEECDASFYNKLRYGQKYTFYDEFHAKDTDKRLKKWTMTYKEQYDYNKSPDFPVFDWTKEILATNGKVVANTSMRVLEAKTPYPVLAIPAKRAYDNLFIRYDLVYSTDAAGTNKYSHAECAYYEISRCGDGILDIAQEGDKWESEQCDPGSEGTKVLPDGRICNSDCTIGSAPKTGTLKIEKTLKNKKEVTKTGEILTWDVRVRAEGGDVTNFKVEDLLPIALEYQAVKVIKNDDNLTLTGPVLSGATITGDSKRENYTGNVYIWDVTGTLKNGHELILQITTKVVKMPKSQDDYRNVACVTKNNTTIECDDDQPGTRRVEKTLIGSKEVKNVGDEVTWKLKLIVDKGEIKNPVIRDILPPVLGYNTGSYVITKNPGIIIYTPITGTTTSGGQELEEIVWNTKGTVKEGEFVEIQLTTYVKVMPDKEYKNVLCVKPDDEEEKCDPEPIGPNLRIKKYHLNADGTTTKDEKTVKIGDEISYKILFGNDGTSSATITSIKDFLPKNVEYLTGMIVIDRKSEHTNGTTTSGETIDVLRGEKLTNGFKVVEGVHIEIYGGMTLEPGDTGYIILTGKVLGSNLDNRVNYACIYLNDKKIDCDDVTHKIDSLICSKEDFKITTTVFSYLGGSTDVACGTSPKGEKADIITIDCGVGSTGIRYYTGEKVSSLTGKCTYPGNSNSSPVGYRIQCKVNNVESNDCVGAVTVNGHSTPGGGEDPHCKAAEVTASGNYIRNVTCRTDNSGDYLIGIKCFKGDSMHVSAGKTSGFTYACDYSSMGYGKYEIQCFVPKYKSSDIVTDDDTLSRCSAEYEVKCVSNCGGGGSSSPGSPGNPPKPDTIYDSVNCFNVNAGNASIEQGEILPFYWNIEKLSKAISSGSFSSTSSTGTVYKTGMFTGYNTSQYPYGKAENYDNIKGKTCTGSEDGMIALNSMMCSFEIRDGLGNRVRSDTYPCLDSKSKKVEPALLSGWADWSIKRYVKGKNSFWSFDTYNDKNYAFRSNVNYIPDFGEGFNIFGEYKISLTKVAYLQCKDGIWTEGNENPIKCQSNFVLTSPYTVQKTPSGNLKASTDELDKYLYMDGTKVYSGSNLIKDAIAVSTYSPNKTVTDAMNAFINKYQRLAVSINKDGKVVKKVPGKDIYFIDGDRVINNKDFEKPFTFVQTNPDKNITIKGNITNLNMMVLTRGKIIFEDSNSCNNRQTVKGIFYAEKGIERRLVTKNTKNRLNDSKRCTEGGLTIKGVIIGDGLQKMMKNSRSNLNDWFESTTDKKGTVMNGASVLIEYSPSVFTKSTMPPGAEDFTTALSIYKN